MVARALRSGAGGSTAACRRAPASHRSRRSEPASARPCRGSAGPSGSNTRLMAWNTSSSAEPNCVHIGPSFSTPTPCSPVTVPPTATQSSRISAPSRSARSSSSGPPGVEQDQRVQVAVARRGRRWRPAGPDSRDIAVDPLRARSRGGGAGSCRPCSSSPARAGRRPERPTCGPTTCARAPRRPSRPARSWRRSRVRSAAVSRQLRRCDVVRPGRRARRAAGLSRPADSRSARTPRPP